MVARLTLATARAELCGHGTAQERMHAAREALQREAAERRLKDQAAVVAARAQMEEELHARLREYEQAQVSRMQTHNPRSRPPHVTEGHGSQLCASFWAFASTRLPAHARRRARTQRGRRVGATRASLCAAMAFTFPSLHRSSAVFALAALRCLPHPPSSLLSRRPHSRFLRLPQELKAKEQQLDMAHLEYEEAVRARAHTLVVAEEQRLRAQHAAAVEQVGGCHEECGGRGDGGEAGRRGERRADIS